MGRYLRVNLLGPGPSSYEKRIYRAVVSQRLRNNDLYGRSVEAAMLATVPMALLLTTALLPKDIANISKVCTVTRREEVHS